MSDSTYLRALDKSERADARRFRWLLNGHGYYLEEEMLCGHDSEDADKARIMIDLEMASEG